MNFGRFEAWLNFIMRQKSFLVLIVIAILVVSCVPNKKFVYLQKDDINEKRLPLDTIVRDYPLIVSNYKIQAEDILYISFHSLTDNEYDFFSQGGGGGGTNPNLFIGTGPGALVNGDLVDLDGNVSLPVIGKVKVAGLTVFQAQDSLQEIANKYLENPIVKVRLLNFRITILGEINREGTINLANNRVNLMEAIGQAGGLTDMADKRNIKLIRRIDGKNEVIYINLLDEGFVNSPYYNVHQNDLLIVPSLRQRPYRKYFAQNLSLVVSTLSLILITITLLNTAK